MRMRNENGQQAVAAKGAVGGLLGDDSSERAPQNFHTHLRRDRENLRRGVHETIMAKDDNKFFPSKLRAMLDQVEGMGLSNGSSWVSEGHAFAIHDPDVFMVDIAPRFFDKQSRLRSFHRQLSIWGFSRLETGPAGRGVWYHKHFIRDKPELIKLIKRVPVKNPKQTAVTSKNQLPDYTNFQIPSSSETQPGQPQPPGPPQGGMMPHPPAVHPHPSDMSAGGGGGSMPPSAYGSTPPGLDYLSTLAAGRLPPVLPPQYYSGAGGGGGGGAQTPASMDQARRYHQSMANQYPPNLLRYHSSMGGYLPPQGPPTGGSGADIGDVAQQLSALRNNPSTPGGGPGGQQQQMDGSNMDSALLDYPQDSRRQNHPPPPPPPHNGSYPPPGQPPGAYFLNM